MSAPLRALETGARIAAADTGRVAREIFARSRGAADTRGARLTGKQDDIFFDDGWTRSNFACVGFDHFRFGVFMFGVLVLSMFMFVLDMFVFRVFSMFDMVGMTQSSSVFGAFVSGVSLEFGAIRGAVLFDFFSFSFGELGFRSSLVFGRVQVRFFLAFFFLGFFLREFGCASGVNFLGFVFFEFGATGESIHLGVIGSFFVFCLG